MPHEYRINKNKKRRERRLVNIQYKTRKQIMKKEVTKELPFALRVQNFRLHDLMQDLN